ncbi:MAG: hypothetical protein IJP33_03555 [Firmicutes bacterium]|nr:hypothetical protein [Bacillota bacterium]
MRKYLNILLVLTLLFVLSACTEAGEEKDSTTLAEHKTIVEGKYVSAKDIPPAFSLLDGVENANNEILQAKQNNSSANNDLSQLSYYYIPTYADTWCEPIWLTLNGGSNGNIVIIYRIKDAPEDSGKWALTLQFNRDGDHGAVFHQNLVSISSGIPLETCEGIYYTDVYNPSDNGELSLTQFCWVHDGYSFMMQVWPEVMEQILENDPNALKGAPFELEKVILDDAADDDEVE